MENQNRLKENFSTEIIAIAPTQKAGAIEVKKFKETINQNPNKRLLKTKRVKFGNKWKITGEVAEVDAGYLREQRKKVSQAKRQKFFGEIARRSQMMAQKAHETVSSPHSPHRDIISQNQLRVAQVMQNRGSFISNLLFTPQRPPQPRRTGRIYRQRPEESTSSKISRLLFG